jgi:predicted MPP superfamily phosphohydrolase
VEVINLHSALQNFKIVQFSDLHFSGEMRENFLKKLLRKILNLKPDIIVFTGDFLCYSRLEKPDVLKKFLNSLYAPFGCFAIFGNHDYENFVSVNSYGEYDVINPTSSTITMGFKRLFSKLTLTKIVTEKAKNTNTHKDLLNLLKETPFQVLDNQTVLLPIKDEFLNITGLGEYSLGKCLPEIAFKNYNSKYPGIVLAHNPDSLSLLKNYPGNIILSGHTHGGQINVMPFRKKFTALENEQLLRGFLNVENKNIYVNRGIGSVMPFRMCAMPEILELTLVPGSVI